jgi:hypothetical protein
MSPAVVFARRRPPTRVRPLREQASALQATAWITKPIDRDFSGTA